MSWNISMLKEAFRDNAKIRLKRQKTKRNVRVVFFPEEPYEIITPLLLEPGEVLEHKTGAKLIILGVTGLFVDTWPVKSYEVEVVEK